MISASNILWKLVLWVLEDVKRLTSRELQEPLEVSYSAEKCPWRLLFWRFFLKICNLKCPHRGLQWHGAAACSCGKIMYCSCEVILFPTKICPHIMSLNMQWVNCCLTFCVTKIPQNLHFTSFEVLHTRGHVAVTCPFYIFLCVYKFWYCPCCIYPIHFPATFPLVCTGVMLSIFFIYFLICWLACCSAATMALTLANLEGEESFDASMLGQADEVVQERICDDELIVIKRWVDEILYILLLQILFSYLAVSSSYCHSCHSFTILISQLNNTLCIGGICCK